MFKKAFTLVELLVVISIVGILSGFVFVQTNNAINSGKDAKRKSDIALLASAAVGYQSESIDMPISSGCSINVDCPTVVNEALEGQIGTLPVDPNSGSAYQYQSIDGTDCTISAVLSTGETYQYSCSGDEISQSAPIAGVCGSRANSSSSGYPSSQTDWTSETTYCSSATPSTTPSFPATPGSSVSWSCPGTYLGESTTCTAYRVLDGVCGSGATNTYTIPTANFCSSGTASSVSGEGPWSWTCAGVYGGTAPACTANKSVDGVCGSANKTYAYDVTSYGSDTFCTAGSSSPATPSFPAQGGSTSWTCVGQNGGTTASCSASRNNAPVNGVCGTSNNSNFYSAPSTNLCSVGTASSVSGEGPWSWTCAGIYSGTTASCTANKSVDGVCGSSNGATLSSPPTTNLCSVGTASASGSWSWTCSSLNGGTVASCSANYQAPSYTMCSGAHTAADCSSAGGGLYNTGSCYICQFSGSSCASGWSDYGYSSSNAQNFSGSTAASFWNGCSGSTQCYNSGGSCTASVSVGAMSFGNNQRSYCGYCSCLCGTCGISFNITLSSIGCY